MKQPTKAIICAAGIGSRFLPQTKAMPKEMLPIVDKPVIQLIVELAVAAGVTDVIIVGGSTKRAIEDHFDRSDSLEKALREKGKDDKAEEIQAIAEMANFVYIRQKGPYGNGTPVLNASHLIDEGEPFFVFFADDFFRSNTPWPVQLKEAYNKTGKSVVSLAEIDKKDSSNYGIADIAEEEYEGLYRMKGLIEKPNPEDAPSKFAIPGSYLLTADIIPILEQQQLGSNGELNLVDSITELARRDKVYGCVIDGIWHDTGDQLKYVMAVVDYALENDKYSVALKEYLQKRLR